MAGSQLGQKQSMSLNLKGAHVTSSSKEPFALLLEVQKTLRAFLHCWMWHLEGKRCFLEMMLARVFTSWMLSSDTIKF